MSNPQIIAVASGKGGVGKSMITANLAAALADAGKSVIAVDLDLGGSNLHSYLGMPNKHPGVGDYLVARHGRLEEFIVPTGIDNLSFIPGDGRTPCMANIAFSEKVRLMLAIRWLKADYVLLDLGGGSSFNTLDFYALAPSGLMVTTLEYPSIMNFLVFLRNYMFRAFDRDLKNFPGIPELMVQFRQTPMTEGQLTTSKMVQQIGDADPEAGAKAKGICTKQRPRVIYNFCLLPEQLKICSKIDESARTILGVPVEHFGAVFEDRTAREAAYRTVPLLSNYPDCSVTTRLKGIAERIINNWDDKPENSAAWLMEDAEQFYRTLS